MVVCPACGKPLTIPAGAPEVIEATLAVPVGSPPSTDFDFGTRSKSEASSGIRPPARAQSVAILLMIVLSPAVVLIVVVACGWFGWSIYDSQQREVRRQQDMLAIIFITDLALRDVAEHALQQERAWLEADSKAGLKLTKERTEQIARAEAKVAQLQKQLADAERESQRRWSVSSSAKK